MINLKLSTKALATVLLMLFSCSVALAQELNVTGSVKDETGQPIIGAGVLVQGKTIGVSTDLDGKFSIKVSVGDYLQFSSIGFISQILPASKTMNVVLAEDKELLDEVVVLGYGTTKAKNFTGSVDQVKLTDSPIGDLNLSKSSDLLRGRLSGVVLDAESGTVGQETGILVRGRKSVNSTTEDPLIILNGVIFSGTLDDISPSTIESISVLKDATSLAAYGSRAAQGVIMVNTKKGEVGKPKINFSTSHQFSGPTYRQKFQDGAGYILYKNMKYGNLDNLDNITWMTPLEKANYDKHKETDWYKLMTRTAYTSNYNLSFSGGSERFNYYVGAGRSIQQGVKKGNDFVRNNLSVNLSSHITDWLQLGMNFNFTNTLDDSMSANLGQARLTPYGEPYLPNGKYRKYPDGEGQTMVSGLWDLNGYADKETRRNNLNLGGFVNIKIPWVQGLSLRANLSYTSINNSSKYFYHETYYPSIVANDFDGIGYASPYLMLGEANGSTSLSENTSWVMDYILTYARDFGEHSINASLVYTRDSDKTVTQSYSGKDFTDAGNTIMGWYGLGDAAVQTVKSPTYVLHTDVGYLARAIYAYRDTYHINVSFRRDGSSVFGKNHKWGSFPAVGGAWTMSNEPFMQNATWLNLLKLKLSWGMNGAQTLSPYGTLSTIKLAKSGGIAAYYDGQVHWGQTISTLGNPDLGWQTTTSWNGGIEAEFIKRRIAIEANVYKSKTTEQIFDRNIPIMNTGITKQKATMGRVDNWGVEINLNTVNVKQRNFRWESDVVFTLNRNKLVDLYGDGQDDITSSLFIGKSLGAIYGYRVSRINTETGFPIYFDADGNETDNPAATDRTILGYKMENFRINFSNTFTWGNLQLYIMLSGIFGGNGYGLDNNTFAYSTYNTGTGFSAYDIPFWTPYNKSSVYPSPQFTNPSKFYAVYNSYGHVRLQDVSLSYNIAPHLTKIGISGAKISVSGRNLFYIAPKWKMSDPEARSDSSVSLPRAVTIALNLTF